MSRHAVCVIAVLGCLVLGLAACPHHGPDGGGKGTGSGSGTNVAQIDAGVAEVPERHPGQPLLPVDGVAWSPVTGCVYHAAAAGYFACTNANAGTCFHFGAPCAPRDACMFDAATGRYASCTTIVEGTCAAWGSACTPTAACMFDPRDNLHHTCDAVTDGACTQWGGLCDPG